LHGRPQRNNLLCFTGVGATDRILKLCLHGNSQQHNVRGCPAVAAIPGQTNLTRTARRIAAGLDAAPGVALAEDYCRKASRHGPFAGVGCSPSQRDFLPWLQWRLRRRRRRYQATYQCNAHDYGFIRRSEPDRNFVPDRKSLTPGAGGLHPDLVRASRALTLPFSCVRQRHSFHSPAFPPPPVSSTPVFSFSYAPIRTDVPSR
jgi:hypothetical protein